MNKARHKQLSDLRERLNAARDLIDGIKDDLEMVKDDEQTYYDDMPESFRQAEKGEKAEAVIGQLDYADSMLDSVLSDLDQIGSCIDDASGE